MSELFGLTPLPDVAVEDMLGFKIIVEVGSPSVVRIDYLGLREAEESNQLLRAVEHEPGESWP